MIERLLNALAGTPDSGDDPEEAGRIAIAAVLVEAARADGRYEEHERDVIDRVLADRFMISDEAAGALRREGETAQAEAVDLVRFTRAIKDSVPFEDRVAVIEAVWRVIYSDDDLHHNESSLVRRLSGLLYVPDQEAGLARQRVTAAPRNPRVP